MKVLFNFVAAGFFRRNANSKGEEEERGEGNSATPSLRKSLR